MEQVHGTATVTITLAWAAVLPAESLKGSTTAEVLQDNHENVMRSKALNSCIQQSFFNKRVMQTSTEVVFGKDMSRWLLPKSSKCACNCVRAIPEQPLRYWRSNRRRCHHIQEAPPSDHPRAKWFTVIESLRTNKPENQLQPTMRCIKKVVAFHTLHLPDSPFPISPSLVKVSLKDIAHLSQGIVESGVFCGWFEPTTPAPWPKGQRVKGCPPKKWRGKG